MNMCHKKLYLQTSFIFSASGERVLFKKFWWGRALVQLNNQNVIVLQE
jgi:hypothetical protein